MMFTKDNIEGVDVSIDGFQRWLYPKLVAKWGLEANSDKDYNCYARVYKNRTKDGYIPEAYIGGKNYRELLLDDKVKVLSYFSVGDTTTFAQNRLVTNVGLVFMADLSKITNNQDRMDEKVRQDVVQLVQGIRFYGFSFQGVETGVDNVYREFSGARIVKGIKFSDMHPNHCFRVNFTLSYKSNC